MDVKLKDWSQQDRQAGRTLAFGLWNGRVSVQVYNNQDMKNKLFRRNLDESEIIMIEKVIAKIMNGSPETKQSIQFTKYDPATKQRSLESVIEFGKDSKQVYHFTVSDVARQQTYTFALKARSNMTIGSDPMSEGTVSALKVETLKDWLTSAKFCAPFTVQPIDPSKRGNYGGKSYSGGGYSAPATTTSAAPSGGDGDLPF